MAKPPFSLAALLIRVFTFGLGVGVFLQQPGVRQALHLGDVEGGGASAPGFLFGLMAPAFFLWALWAASNVFVRMRQGDAFGPAVVRGLNQIGAGLMLGAWCAILLQPAMAYLIANGFREMRGVRFNYTVENLTLALVGLVLILMARQGRALKANLEQFV